MSNERIDLTQFEGMTKGPWRIPEHAAEIVDSEDYAVLWVDFSGESPAEYMFRNSALHCAHKEDIEAMAKVPELIAELERCYEKIDWLQQAADLASNYIGEIHHSHWDIFEERMIEAGLWERPSE